MSNIITIFTLTKKNKTMELEKFAKENGLVFNGYSYFNEENYKAKNDKPCFIPENTDTLNEVRSYKSMFDEVLETIKTKSFLLAVCENYDANGCINSLESTPENTIDYEDVYLEITDSTPEKFAESFMDSYFLSGDEVWCSISTKLVDYMM